MKTTEQLKSYFAARPGITMKRAASNLGMKVSDIRRLLGEKAADTPQPSVGKSVTSLLAEFDDVAKVKNAMKALPKTEYLHDEELRRNLNLGSQRWRDVRGQKEIAHFRFKLPKSQCVWMHPSAQETISRAINLSLV